MTTSTITWHRLSDGLPDDDGRDVREAAAQRIDALEAEQVRLKDAVHSARVDEAHCWSRRNDALESENAALRVDAERYRWLRLGAYECVIPHGGTLGGKRTAWITKLHPGESFDAAIDAARSKT